MGQEFREVATAELRRKLSNGVPVFNECVDDAFFYYFERERTAGRFKSMCTTFFFSGGKMSPPSWISVPLRDSDPSYFASNFDLRGGALARNFTVGIKEMVQRGPGVTTNPLSDQILPALRSLMHTLATSQMSELSSRFQKFFLAPILNRLVQYVTGILCLAVSKTYRETSNILQRYELKWAITKSIFEHLVLKQQNFQQKKEENSQKLGMITLGQAHWSAARCERKNLKNIMRETILNMSNNIRKLVKHVITSA